MKKAVVVLAVLLSCFVLTGCETFLDDDFLTVDIIPKPIKIGDTANLIVKKTEKNEEDDREIARIDFDSIIIIGNQGVIELIEGQQIKILSAGEVTIQVDVTVYLRDPILRFIKWPYPFTMLLSLEIIE